MACESNGNTLKSNHLAVAQRTHGSSNEDLSEYTDADESISAPTEFLSEFLSALMLKDYARALKYCELILHYEPNNSTAKEFYPLILEKLQHLTPSEDDLSISTNSEEDPEPISSHSDSQSDSDSDDNESSDSEKISLEQEPSYEENALGLDNSTDLGNLGGLENLEQVSIKSLSPRVDSDGTTNSYSSLEDEEIIARDENALEEVVIHNTTVDDNNGNTIFASTISIPTTSDNSNFNWFTKRKDKNKNSMEGTNTTFQMSSDSESPTDPVTQQTVEMLRLKFVQAST